MAEFKFAAHTKASEHRMDLLLKSARVGGLESVAAFAAAQIQRDSKGAFLAKADPSTGDSWPPRKVEPKDGHPVLRQTGALWSEVIGEYTIIGEGKARMFATLTSGAASEPYAMLHQFGGTSDMAPGPAAVAARPFAGLTDKSAEMIQRHAIGPSGFLGPEA